MVDYVVHVSLILLGIFIKGSGGSSCQYSYYSYFYGSQYSYKYCSNGCCGSTYSSYCCYSYISYYTGYAPSTGVIAGSVIGGIVGLGVLIAAIVCISVACCASKSRGRIGRVNRVQIANAGLVTTTTTSAYPMQTMYAQRPMPPPYMGPPPSYGDGAYNYPPQPYSYQPLNQPSPASGQVPAYAPAPPPAGYNIPAT